MAGRELTTDMPYNKSSPVRVTLLPGKGLENVIRCFAACWLLCTLSLQVAIAQAPGDQPAQSEPRALLRPAPQTGAYIIECRCLWWARAMKLSNSRLTKWPTNRRVGPRPSSSCISAPSLRPSPKATRPNVAARAEQLLNAACSGTLFDERCRCQSSAGRLLDRTVEGHAVWP